jgi:hypothetical protein
VEEIICRSPVEILYGPQTEETRDRLVEIDKAKPDIEENWKLRLAS